jgi:asparagine synthase (glutamine-hydrolysing)
MLATMDRRGPDQAGDFFAGNVALGHKRLSIMDLTESGRQPMVDLAAGLAMVFNGEVYNYQEVRGSLRSSYSWKSRTDTEVLLNAYKELGTKRSSSLPLPGTILGRNRFTITWTATFFASLRN